MANSDMVMIPVDSMVVKQDEFSKLIGLATRYERKINMLLLYLDMTPEFKVDADKIREIILSKEN